MRFGILIFLLGMIFNKNESSLKFFDLKEYNEIFTIRVETGWNIQSLGNMHLMTNSVGRFENLFQTLWKIE